MSYLRKSTDIVLKKKKKSENVLKYQKSFHGINLLEHQSSTKSKIHMYLHARLYYIL